MIQDPISVSVLGVPGVVVLWVLSLLAFGVFGLRAWQLIGLLRRARPENRFDQLGRRVQRVIKHVLLQPRLFNERSIGLPHLLIFWGFVVYVVCFMWGLLRGLFPFLPVPYPDEVPAAAFFLEVFAVVVLVSLAIAAVRRAFFAPPHLHLSWDASLILVLIGMLMLSSLFGAAFRLVAESAAPEVWTPFSGLVASLFRGLAADRAAGLVHAMWWLHMVVVLSFLVYLPFSKHLHLLASPFNVFFGDLRPPGDLSLAGASEESAAGASVWNEFTWKQLLSGFSCAECGRCDRACPAATAGYPLLPQQIIQKLKKHSIEVGLAKPGKKGDGAALIGGAIAEAELWACTTCMSCMERCAVLNEQIPVIVQLRRHQVGQGAVEKNVQDMLANLTRYGNSFGKSDRMRAKWTQPLGWKIKDVRREQVEYLWYVGDYASYDPRLEDITRKTAELFRLGGLDFGILYEGERNAGNDVRRVGEEGLFDMLREKNLQVLGKAQFKTIVTTDPHTYNTLKNEYGYGGNGATVLHSTEVLDRLLQEGRLPLKRKLGGRATYHDPCYLGRYNEVYEPARRALRSLGVDLVEMPRSRNRSYCCGAGGGRIWMEDVPGIKERPSENRVREAAALPGVATLVVACPKDIAMFRDAVKTTGTEGTLAVRDLAELVWDAVQETAVPEAAVQG
jgi:Fe-S oxidoreductase